MRTLEVAGINLLVAVVAVVGLIVGMTGGIAFGKDLERRRVRRIMRELANRARARENAGEFGARLEVPGIMRAVRTLFSVEDVP